MRGDLGEVAERWPMQVSRGRWAALRGVIARVAVRVLWAARGDGLRPGQERSRNEALRSTGGIPVVFQNSVPVMPASKARLPFTIPWTLQ